MQTSNKPSPPEPWFIALVLDQFPAQVLTATNASLAHKAFGVIQQNADSHKTFLIAVSPAARAAGLYAGMPVAIAQRRYRNLQVIHRNLDFESRALQKLETLLYRFSPDFQVKKNGRCIIDVTGTPVLRRYQPEQAAETIRAYLQKHLRFPEIAMGTATTRLLAQVLAARAQPPTHIGYCPKGQELATLDPLSPDTLPGLSSHCHTLLKKYALYTIGQVKSLGKAGILSHFGNEGEKLYSLVSGLDLQTRSHSRERLQAETILEHDLNSDEALAKQVRFTVDQFLFQMRQQKIKADRFALQLRYSDHKVVRKTFSLTQATDNFLALAESTVKIFFATYQRRVALKSITIHVVHPKSETGQTDLFTETPNLRQQAIAEALGKIRRKNGFATILSASNIESAD